MPFERALWSGKTGSEATRYTMIDDRINLYPTPPAGQVYEMLYIGQPPFLSAFADEDLIDVVVPDGEAFLIWGVCVKALAKSESSVQLAIAEREAARKRLETWSVNRALTQPRRRFTADQDDYGFVPPRDGDWSTYR